MYKFDDILLSTGENLANIEIRINDWQAFQDDPNANQFLKITMTDNQKYGHVYKQVSNDYFIRYQAIIAYSPAQLANKA